MSEPPDLAELARRYADLWQEYLTALAQDDAAAHNFAALFTQAGAAFAASAAAVRKDPAGHAGSERPDQNPKRRPGGTRKRGPGDGAPPEGVAPATALSPGGGDGSLDQLSRRIAELEERLDSISAESGVSGSGEAGGSPARRSRRRPG
ncbi:MAG: hypothetical protein O3A96_03975 [Proteobacteria bacterium]|nr:hypothetical protein [Pseudomonadota bacterium]